MILLLLGDSGQLTYRHLSFYLETGYNRQFVGKIPVSVIKRVLSSFRLTNRLFRLEPRCTIQLADDLFLVCLLHKVWLLDIKKKKISEIWQSPHGFSDPLNFCSDGQFVYWGDYGDNPTHDAVKIYRIDQSMQVEVVYQFTAGDVRHIHNIIFDKDQKCFFILTGDMGDSSGIYRANEDWSAVEPLRVGKQKYRAVVGFPFKHGLIYVTDSVSEENHICYLQGDNFFELSSFPGSCIYGTETRNYFVFSSIVEPPEGRGFSNLFTYKLAKGIKDRYSHLIKVRKADLKVEEILKVKKDFLPMKLFQYGAIMFPNGQVNSDKLWYRIVACQGDGQFREIGL